MVGAESGDTRINFLGAPRCKAVAWRSTKSGQPARNAGRPAIKFLKHRVMRVAASDGSLSGAMGTADRDFQGGAARFGVATLQIDERRNL